VWTEPDRASFHTLPRTSLSTFSPDPAAAHTPSAPFFFVDIDRLRHDIERAGFEVRHSEVVDVE